MAPKKAAARAEEAKTEELKVAFSKLDDNGDGFLSLEELHDLLKKGNPTFTEKEIKQLYDKCDTNHDGKVSFQEFVDYIYKKEHPNKERTSADRHKRMAAATGPHNDGTETDWGPIEDHFVAFAGRDGLDGREFAKFCKDCNLLGSGFGKADVDLTFAKVLPPRTRKMDFPMFQDAVRLIAGKRGMHTGDVMSMIVGSDGPVMTATKTDTVRFYDDKSTFTGAHAHNDKFEGVDSTKALGRHEKAVSHAYRESHGGEEGDWGECERVFNAFCEHHHFESKCFVKMCKEVEGLLGDGFAKGDIDVIFTAAKGASRERHLNFDQFKEAVRKIAAKKKTSLAEVQRIIAGSQGPIMHATATEYTRFHDDKTTYTGAHAMVHGRGEHGDGRHEKLAEEAKKLAESDEGEHSWDACDAVFDMFCEHGGVLHSRDFNKLMNDIAIFDGKFTKGDVDSTFVHAVGRGRREMNVEQFHVAIREVAKKKQCAIWQVQRKIENCEGPHVSATKCDAVRFHDDKDTYTGMHVGK